MGRPRQGIEPPLALKEASCVSCGGPVFVGVDFEPPLVFDPPFRGDDGGGYILTHRCPGRPGGGVPRRRYRLRPAALTGGGLRPAAGGP